MIGGAGTRGCEAADYLHEASACEGQKLQPMTKISVACRESQREGREGGTKSQDEGPCFILYFPYIHFTYTYRKLVFDTHAWIGV